MSKQKRRRRNCTSPLSSMDYQSQFIAPAWWWGIRKLEKQSTARSSITYLISSLAKRHLDCFPILTECVSISFPSTMWPPLFTWRVGGPIALDKSSICAVVLGTRFQLVIWQVKFDRSFCSAVIHYVH